MKKRLAELLLGYPVMFDPFEGEDGTFVVIREKGTVVTVKAATFRLRSGLQFAHREDSTTFFGAPEAPERAGVARRWGRFAGTVAYR